jgi:hypothetical protein
MVEESKVIQIGELPVRKIRPNLINVISISVTNLPDNFGIDPKNLPKENVTLDANLIQKEYKNSIFNIEHV